MTEKRFTMEYGKYIDNVDNVEYDEKWESWKICDLLNKFYDENKELYEKNQLLNEKNQLLNEKEKDMVNYLKKEYEYTYNQRMKHLDDAVLVTCYEMIEYHIRSMIEHLEGL